MEQKATLSKQKLPEGLPSPAPLIKIEDGLRRFQTGLIVTIFVLLGLFAILSI
jgi:hypothetical protein